MVDRPTLTLENDPKAVEDFVAGLQAAIDAWDADGFNRQFAGDVLWGSPFGAVVSGYDEIHAIHSRMHAAASQRQAEGEGGGSRYEIEHARLVAEGTAIAYVRRFSLAEGVEGGEGVERGEEQPGRTDAFDELALFVLVHRDGAWWLAAGLHTPDRRDVYR
jgi:ketosteroid isomerase-like protein